MSRVYVENSIRREQTLHLPSTMPSKVVHNHDSGNGDFPLPSSAPQPKQPKDFARRIACNSADYGGSGQGNPQDDGDLSNEQTVSGTKYYQSALMRPEQTFRARRQTAGADANGSDDQNSARPQRASGMKHQCPNCGFSFLPDDATEDRYRVAE